MTHGTYSGYQRCKLTVGGACDACKAASAAYQREWRANNPDGRGRQKAASSARSRALTKLAALHPDEYARLVREERRAS